MRVAVDRLRELPPQLTIHIDGDDVTIVDAMGRITKLRAHPRKEARVTVASQIRSVLARLRHAKS